MAKSYWVTIFNGSTWQEFLSSGGAVSGNTRRNWNKVKKIAPGDWLLCYVTGVSRWIGILEVTGKPYLSEEPLYSLDAYPARLPVKVLVALEPEHAIPVTLLRDRLSYFQTEAPNAWKWHFRSSPMLESREDAEVVVAALQSAADTPISRPYSEAKWKKQTAVPQADGVIETIPLNDEPSSEDDAQPASVTHEEIQALLLRLGSEMSFRVWVARNDRGRSFAGQILGEMPGMTDKLPTQFDPSTNKTIELIDVLWLDGNAIVAAFEVEHTTSVYSGLLRMADLVSMQPNLNIRLYIVAPDARRERVLSEIARPVFSRLKPPLSDRCQYIPYSELKAKEEQLRGLTQYLKPEFLDEIAESAD